MANLSYQELKNRLHPVWSELKDLTQAPDLMNADAFESSFQEEALVSLTV